MATKTTGLEYKAFIREDWPDDKWMDDELLEVNGVEFEGESDKLNDSDAVKIIAGVVYHGDKDWSLVTEFKRWRLKQTTESFTVTADKSIVAAVKDAILKAGGKVS